MMAILLQLRDHEAFTCADRHQYYLVARDQLCLTCRTEFTHNQEHGWEDNRPALCRFCQRGAEDG